ncbi:MAG: FkbM family methyltransferase [Bacteroidales bacterium]|nr:FkbM family methyltransferase [Bacteroidales bacterium]
MNFLKYFVPIRFRRKVQASFKSIQFLHSKALEDDVLWCNELERQFIRKNFGDVTKLPDFVPRFKRLINGLDEESVACLAKVISRQKQIIGTEENTIDLFSEEEKQQIKKVDDVFKHEVVQLTESLYAYKNYLLPINHFEKSVFYYKHGIDKLQTADRVKQATIFDVGGFIGDSALVFEELSPQRIITFEPVPENQRFMEKTIELNDMTNVTVVKKALADHEGVMTMNVYGSESSLYDISSSAYEGKVEIPITTLDNYVLQEKIDDIALIKVDIEGAEQLFLEGAKKTIRQQKPILLISIYHKADDFFGIKPLIESWDLGYTFRIHKPLFENATSEVLLIGEIL